MEFYTIGKEIHNWSGQPMDTASLDDHQFLALFGCGAEVALAFWKQLFGFNLLDPGTKIIHLLWALNFMK
jgi:hypothetical protein